MSALKTPVTILLIMLVSLQTFSKWCLILEFQINRDYIAKNLCVNRAKPLSCCAGKCYLKKKIATDESQQQAPGKGGQKEESPLQILEGIDLPASLTPIAIALNPTRYLDDHSQEFYHAVFQPPQA